jgi:HEAT repeat protein
VLGVLGLQFWTTYQESEAGMVAPYERPVSYWLRQMKHRDWSYRADAIDALGSLPTRDEAIVPALLAALRDNEVRVRHRAVYALGKKASEDDRAVAGLVAAAKDSGRLVRLQAYVGMGRIGARHPEVVPALVDGLSDQDYFVRLAAVQALGRIGPPAKDKEAVRALRPFLEERNDMLRKEADLAIRLIEGKAQPQPEEPRRSSD